MLKHRLILGTLMTVFFIAVVIFGGWFDGSLTASADDDKPVQGTILCIFIAVLIFPTQFELAKLAAAKGLKILRLFQSLLQFYLQPPGTGRSFSKLKPQFICFFFRPLRCWDCCYTNIPDMELWPYWPTAAQIIFPSFISAFSAPLSLL